MINKLRQQLWVRKNTRAIKHHYLRWPYRMRKDEVFDDFNHEHTCLAARLTNIDLTEICPLEDKKTSSLATEMSVSGVGTLALFVFSVIPRPEKSKSALK